LAANPVGEEETGPLRLQFDRSVNLASAVRRSAPRVDCVLHRGLDDALGLTNLATNLVADPRVGKNNRHHLSGLLCQSAASA
jgi:hypothetical protein